MAVLVLLAFSLADVAVAGSGCDIDHYDKCGPSLEKYGAECVYPPSPRQFSGGTAPDGGGGGGAAVVMGWRRRHGGDRRRRW